MEDAQAFRLPADQPLFQVHSTPFVVDAQVFAHLKNLHAAVRHARHVATNVLPVSGLSVRVVRMGARASEGSVSVGSGSWEEGEEEEEEEVEEKQDVQESDEEENCGEAGGGDEGGGESEGAKGEPTPEPHGTEVTCVMCLEEHPSHSMFHPHCMCAPSEGHFCESCAANLVNTTIQQTVKEAIVCPLCSRDWALEDILALASLDSQLKFVQRRLRHDINQAGDVVWCPNAGCETAFLPPRPSAPSTTSASSGAPAVTRCCCPACALDFCAICRVPWHEGVSCVGLEARDHARDVEESEQWMRRNTKPCPRCHSPICAENSRSVTCYNCRFKFCYRCGCKWHSKHDRKWQLRGCPGRNIVSMWNRRAYRVELVLKIVGRAVALCVLAVVGACVAAAVAPVVLCWGGLRWAGLRWGFWPTRARRRAWWRRLRRR